LRTTLSTSPPWTAPPPPSSCPPPSCRRRPRRLLRSRLPLATCRRRKDAGKNLAPVGKPGVHSSVAQPHDRPLRGAPSSQPSMSACGRLRGSRLWSLERDHMCSLTRLAVVSRRPHPLASPPPFLRSEAYSTSYHTPLATGLMLSAFPERMKTSPSCVPSQGRNGRWSPRMGDSFNSRRVL